MDKIRENKAADELVTIIREIVQEQLNQKDTTVLGEVIQNKGNNHVDVYIYPDRETVVHNILNSSGYNLLPGDFVHIYKVGNQISKAFIISKIVPYTGIINNTINPVGNSNTVISITSDYWISWENNQWMLNISPKLINNITNSTNVEFGIIRYLTSQTHQGNKYRNYNKKGYTKTKIINFVSNQKQTRPRAQDWVGGTFKNIVIDVVSGIYKLNITDYINNLIYYDIGSTRKRSWINKNSRARYNTYLKQGYWYRKYGFWFKINNGREYVENQKIFEIRNFDQKVLKHITDYDNYIIENNNNLEQNIIIKLIKR